MNKLQIKRAIIRVFENGASFTSGMDFFEIPPLSITPYWTYPTGLSAINDMAIGRSEHPFVHVSGGYEEKPRSHARMVFPAGCRVFYFNEELCDRMIALFGHHYYHNKTINTITHTVLDRYNRPQSKSIEKPDLIEVNGITNNPPSFRGHLVASAADAGHNFICQTPHGIFNKMCHELWRLSCSGVNPCYFVALYTHKQNLAVNERCSYRHANTTADTKYAAELTTYCNDIIHIDPTYIHLIFKGIRALGYFTYFHVFIIEKPAHLNFKVIKTSKGLRLRPQGYQIIGDD